MKKAWDNHRKCRRCKMTRTKNTYCAACVVARRKEKNVAKKKPKTYAEMVREDKALERRYVKAAQRLHHDEGVQEIDDDAQVSFGQDRGAYVQAWVWVPEENL